MLTITIKSAKSTLSFEYPESMTHKVKGVDHKIDLTRVTEAGWRALLAKSKRQISDGSPNSGTVSRKINQLYGLGKPIGARVNRNPVATELAALVAAKLVNAGMRRKDLPKLGRTVEEITSVARKHAVPTAWLKKATKRASQLAELRVAEIE